MATINTNGYATDVHVGSALPNEMNYQLPASLPSAKNFEIRVQPVNAQTFTAGNVVQIDIPCGRPGQYIDPTTTYFRYKVTYTVGAGATAGTDKSAFIGTSYSPFIKQEVYGNNSVLLESINEVGVLVNMLSNLQLNDSDKRGLSGAFGFDSTVTTNCSASSTAGHGILEVVGVTVDSPTLVFEYAFPLIGILGSGTDKFFPIGSIYGLRLELTMDSYTNFTKLIGGTAAKGVTSAIISDFEFVANVVELAPEAQAIVDMANPEKIHIRSMTYRQASNSLPGGTTSGTNDLLVGIRVSSLKSMLLACSPSNATEGKFAGVNPNLDQGTSYIIAGQQYPQRTLNPSNKPADAYMQTQKAMGALSFSQFNGCISKSAYYSSSVNNGLMLAYNATKENARTNPNQFFLGVDVEVVARKSALLSGINVNSSPMFFRAQIGTNALSAFTHTFNFFGFYDVILEIDKLQRNIIAKF